MYFSKYNLVVPLNVKPDHCVIHNLFSGNAVITTLDFARRLGQRGGEQDLEDLSREDLTWLQEQSFVLSSHEEERQRIISVHDAYQARLASTNALRRYSLLLTYTCNLRCSYCFQKRTHDGGTMTRERLALALKAIDELETEAARAYGCCGDQQQHHLPLLNIVGGEPLQVNAGLLEFVRETAAFASSRDITYTITSNGYELSKVVPELLKFDKLPGDIQVTLDGVGAVHDSRRPHASSGGTFGRLIEAIDAAIGAGIHISLRINVDRFNVDCLDQVVELIESRGWYKSDLLSPYVAPVTDHSGVNDDYAWIESDQVLFQAIISIFQRNERMRDLFVLKNFRGYEFVRSCVMEDMSPTPSFWRCEALLGQTVFDPTGAVYPCLEAAGKPDAQVGHFDPKFELFPEQVKKWSQMDTLVSSYCASCMFAFVCSGGCPWHTIRSGHPECTSMSKQMSTAWNYFVGLALGITAA